MLYNTIFHNCDGFNLLDNFWDIVFFIIFSGLALIGILSLYDERQYIKESILNIFKRLVYLFNIFFKLWK